MLRINEDGCFKELFTKGNVKPHMLVLCSVLNTRQKAKLSFFDTMRSCFDNPVKPDYLYYRTIGNVLISCYSSILCSRVSNPKLQS